MPHSPCFAQRMGTRHAACGPFTFPLINTCRIRLSILCVLCASRHLGAAFTALNLLSGVKTYGQVDVGTWIRSSSM